MKAELIPENGDPPIPITRDVTVVGRREYCDIQINDPSLSKRHGLLVKTDGLLVIRDLATTNGTKVKGQRVRWAALMPEDRLAFGSYKVRVYLGPDNVPTPSERPESHKASRAAAPKARPAMAGAGSATRAPLPTGFATPSAQSIPQMPPVAVPGVVELEPESDSQWRNAIAQKPNAGAPVIVLGEDDLLGVEDDIIELG